MSETASPVSVATARPRRRRGIWRWVLLTLFLLLGVLVIGAIVALLLYRGTPPPRLQWEAFRKNTPIEKRQQLAETLDMRWFALANPRPLPNGQGDDHGLGIRHLTVTIDEANSWLEFKSGIYPNNPPGSAGWIQNQGYNPPRAAKEPSLGIEDGKLVLSFMLDTPQLTKLVSFYGEVTVPEEGKVHVKITGVKGGNLSLPGEWMTDQFRENADKDLKLVLDGIHECYEGKDFPAVWDAPGGLRQVRLKAFEVGEDKVEMTFNIVPKPGKGAATP